MTTRSGNSTSGDTPQGSENRCLRDICTPIFTAVLFTIAGKWKQTKCLSTRGWSHKLWGAQSVRYGQPVAGRDSRHMPPHGPQGYNVK